MQEFRVLVHAPQSKTTLQSKQLTVRSSMTFPEFRKICSDALGMEVVSVFSKAHQKIYDLKDMESQPEVLVYDTIYPSLHCCSLTTDSYFLSNEEIPSKRFSDGSEKFRIKLKVETIGKPNSGKTTLIWKFIRSDYHDTCSGSITAVKFEKDIDVDDFNVHFIISDVKEADDNSFLIDDRLLEKDVILMCIAKPSLQENWDWIEWALHKIHKINKTAKLVLAITKSDIRLDDKHKIDLSGLSDLDVLIVRTSSHESYMPSYVKTSEELFTAIAEEYIAVAKGERRPTRIISRISRPTDSISLSRPLQANKLWFLQPLESLKMCFARN